ncbi:hypothetical protein LVY75_34685 (plasmid) [Sinorhizobium sp. B11]
MIIGIDIMLLLEEFVDRLQMKPLPKRRLEHFCCFPVKRSDRAASHPGSASQQRRAIRSLLFPQKLARFGGRLFAHGSRLQDMPVVLSSQKSTAMKLLWAGAQPGWLVTSVTRTSLCGAL